MDFDTFLSVNYTKDTMINHSLQWELDWVMAHVARFGPPEHDKWWHAKAICGNITKRYHAAKAKKILEDYKRTYPHVDTLNELYDHFEINMEKR